MELENSQRRQAHGLGAFMRFIGVYENGKTIEYRKHNFISRSRACEYALYLGTELKAKSVCVYSNNMKRVLFRVIIDD